MKNGMIPPLNRAWSLVVTSAACTALLLAAACGESDPAQSQAAPPSSSPATTVATVTEKPFAAGGKIEMHLGGGGYRIRPAANGAIRVTPEGNTSGVNVEVSTKDTQADVVVKDTPRSNFRATIEVPQTADLVIRLAAGELTVEAIAGNKDIESNAGNVDIVTGDAKDYASVDASVQAGEISADPFGGSRSGIFPKLTWSGNGKYTVRARLIAGNLTLRSK